MTPSYCHRCLLICKILKTYLSSYNYILFPDFKAKKRVVEEQANGGEGQEGRAAGVTSPRAAPPQLTPISVVNLLGFVITSYCHAVLKE